MTKIMRIGEKCLSAKRLNGKIDFIKSATGESVVDKSITSESSDYRKICAAVPQS